MVAAFVVRGGTVLKEAGSAGADAGMLAVTFTRLVKESDLIAAKLGAGQVSAVFLEFGDRLLLILAQKDDQFLVVITTPDISLGRLRYQLGKGLEKEGSGA